MLDAFEVMCCVLLSYAGGHGGRMPYAGVARGKELYAVEGVCRPKAVESLLETGHVLRHRCAGATPREPR